jgi:hydroxymethylbilane synthase
VEFHALGVADMVPAIGQAAVAIQGRASETAKYADVFDAATARAVTLERAFQSAMGGGCHTAFAVHALPDVLHLFHETTGYRRVSLSEADYASPEATAARVLKDCGLRG